MRDLIVLQLLISVGIIVLINGIQKVESSHECHESFNIYCKYNINRTKMTITSPINNKSTATKCTCDNKSIPQLLTITLVTTKGKVLTECFENNSTKCSSENDLKVEQYQNSLEVICEMSNEQCIQIKSGDVILPNLLVTTTTTPSEPWTPPEDNKTTTICLNPENSTIIPKTVMDSYVWIIIIASLSLLLIIVSSVFLHFQKKNHRQINRIRQEVRQVYCKRMSATYENSNNYVNEAQEDIQDRVQLCLPTHQQTVSNVHISKLTPESSSHTNSDDNYLVPKKACAPKHCLKHIQFQDQTSDHTYEEVLLK